MHKVLHGDRATARRIGIDRRGRPEGEIVDVLERANRTIVGRLYEERGIAFVVAENRRINQDLLVPPGRARRARSPATSSSSRSSSSPRRSARRSRASSRCSAATPIPGMEIEIALRKHDLPHEFSLAAQQAGRQAADGGAPTRPHGPRRPHGAAARHDRRRDGEGLRRRRVLRAQGQGLPADRRDRRRLALRARRRCARPRRARARHLGLFPAPRDPDAAGGAVERALLAQARRSTACAWSATWRSTRDGRDRGATSSTRR